MNFYKFLDKLPTTNARIALTLALALGTAIKYWASASWEPAWDWLMFLALMSGLDVAQHWAKRSTSWSPKEQAEAEVIRNGHGTSGQNPSGGAESNLSNNIDERG